MPSAVRQFLWAIPAAITFTDVIASVIKVEGASMQPTLNPPSSSVSDWVLVEKLTIKVWRRYTRGEVVVLW
jgi:signal peptidase I